MFKAIIALAALGAASAANAAVSINFNSPSGNIGTSHTYTSGGLSVTATGYLNGSKTALYGKNGSGDEKGLGLVGDPSHQDEIFYDGRNTDFIQLDVTSILTQVSSATFFMGSTTAGETWKLYGSNTAGQLGTLLLGGNDENSHALADFGQYDFYDFVAGGTVHTSGDYTWKTAGNVLLGGVALTPAVPEPSTWAMMLLGFGAMGFAARRQRKATAQLA